MDQTPNTPLLAKAKELEAALLARDALLRRTKRLTMDQLSKLQIEEARLEAQVKAMRQARFTDQAQSL